MSAILVLFSLLGGVALAEQPAVEVVSTVSATVDEKAIDSEVSAVEKVAWNVLSDVDWGTKADEMVVHVNALIAADAANSDALRPLLFRTLAEAGRAAENGNNARRPLYAAVDDRMVNFNWYLAASLAHQDSSLMALPKNADIRASIDFYLKMIDKGEMPDHFASSK